MLFPASVFGVRTSLPGLRTPHSGLQTPHSGLQTPHSGLQTPDSGLQTPDSGLQTPHSGLQTSWTPQTSHTTARLRGISAVSDKVAWASGANGTCLRTIDGGATWQAATVPGADSLDFRDVEAFDADNAYLLSIGDGEKSRIYKTIDGGRNWKLQFTNTNPKAFFDALAFWDANHGLAFSDPVDGHFLVITTEDGGSTWNEVPAENIPAALPGEGAFAASGTCITVQGRNNVWIATGGGAARVFRSTDAGKSWQVAATPIAGGQPSAGIFSIAFKD
ncbi:MAG: hypothetical protein J2P41_12565, partial [Blastocatellia bacterium]|nr:hypothetical protein [Blastocatellia bacterium]